MKRNWNPIFKLASLPYNMGEEFYAKRNECTCIEIEPYKINCLKTYPCISRFVVLNDQSFFKFDQEEKRNKMAFSKSYLITRFKYWKFINPELSAREDIFVCDCKNTYILRSLSDSSKDDDTKLECCHCKRYMMRCLESCRNAVRGM